MWSRAWGVLVCITDDNAFEQALSAVVENVGPGGVLVLRESFSGWGARTIRDGDYTARHRPKAAYMGILTSRGFREVEDVHLATWSRVGRRTNHLWVLRHEPVAE